MQKPIRLIVQADDFGMCHAVNQGVVRAFSEGILTQATVMVPCPWFPEAAQLALRYAIPVGMHSTLTCEWDTMRWGPLTRGSSLVRPDGTFFESVERAAASVQPGEAAAELEAQAAAMTALGLRPLFFDAHMGLVSREACHHVCELYQLPFILPVVPRFLWLQSFLVLSPMPAEEKRSTLLEHLENLTAGNHLVQAHPALASEELRALAAPGSPAEAWAESYRVSDLSLLIDPEVKRLVVERGIELISVADLEEDAISAGWPGPPLERRGLGARGGAGAPA